MEGQAPSPLEARFAPGAPCPLQQHYARLLMQQQHAVPTSSAAAAGGAALFPYLNALSNNASSPGGSPLGPLGSFRAPHTSPNMAAMRQFWPPTPPPDMSTSPGYSRYGGSYYSLFPPLSSPPDPFGPPGSLFPRLAHSASHYPSLLDRDGGFLSPSLGSPLSHYASALSPLASSSLLSPPTSSSTGTDLSHPGKAVDEPITPTTHSHADSLLTTVAPLTSSTQSVRPSSKPPNAHTRDRCSEKSRSKKSSQKNTNKSGPTDLSLGATQVSSGRTKTVEKCSHCTCKPQNCGTVTSASWSQDLSDSSGTAPTAGVASSPPTEPTTTVGTSLCCIPSDQVSSTVPSPSAHPPPLLSPTGPPVVSSSTPDVSLTPPTPEAATDSPTSNTPPLRSPSRASPLRNLSPTPEPAPELSVAPTNLEKDTSVFARGDCSSTTDECRAIAAVAPVTPVSCVTPVSSVAPVVSVVTPVNTVSPVKTVISPVSTVAPVNTVTPVVSTVTSINNITPIPTAATATVTAAAASCTSSTSASASVTSTPVNHVMPMAPVNPMVAVVPRLPSPKEEKEEARPECRYATAVAKREPMDLDRPTGPALVPLGKNAVMLSVQQTKVVSQTRLRGSTKSSGLAVGMAKASAKTTSVFSTPLGSGTGSPKVQEVAPVNLKISKSCEAVIQKPDGGATSTGIPTCVAVATRRPQDGGGSKIVVEEKCDTTVSVVPALSVLNASSQPIPVGIAVAQQRQDHTITCSKTSLSSSAAEQSHITAVSCSTVILAAGGSDRGPRLCESRQGPAAHQGMAETTTTCLVTAGPVPAHTTWDSHSDALAIRPAAAALPWLTTPAPPVVTTPTIWLPQEATPPPLASPGGFQLARDALTGQLYLVPAAPTSWTLSGTATASPVQQILTTQQHTTFQQIMPDQWRSELKPTATVFEAVPPKLEILEAAKDLSTGAAFAYSTMPTAVATPPAPSVVSYLYDPSAVVQQLTQVAGTTSVVAALASGKVSQGTSPLVTTSSPSLPPQPLVEQGVQACDTDNATEESDDDTLRPTPALPCVKPGSAVTSVTTAIQVDMDCPTTSDDNEPDEPMPVAVQTTDSANQTDDLPQQTTQAHVEPEEHEPGVRTPLFTPPRAKVQDTSDSEIDDSIPVLLTQTSGVQEFIDHHGLDLLVDSIEEFAANQEAAAGSMPRLEKSETSRDSVGEAAVSPEKGSPPALTAQSPSSRPEEWFARRSFSPGPSSKTAPQSPPSPPLLEANLDSPNNSKISLFDSLKIVTDSTDSFEDKDGPGEMALQRSGFTQSKTSCEPDRSFVEGNIFGTTVTENATFPRQRSTSPCKTDVTKDFSSDRLSFAFKGSQPAESGYGGFERNPKEFSHPKPPFQWHDVSKEPVQAGSVASETNLTASSAAATFDTSCTDGLGLLCALAEQRFLEEARKSSEVAELPAEEEKPVLSPVVVRTTPADEAPPCKDSGKPTVAESIDQVEREMRIQLAELQRKYREKQRELAKLQPRKDKECDQEKGSAHKKSSSTSTSHQRKRRHSSTTSQPLSPFDALKQSTAPKEVVADKKTEASGSSKELVKSSCRETTTKKAVEKVTLPAAPKDVEGKRPQPCVPVLTIKIGPEPAVTEPEDKAGTSEPKAAAVTGSPSKQRRKSCPEPSKPSYAVCSSKHPNVTKTKEKQEKQEKQEKPEKPAKSTAEPQQQTKKSSHKASSKNKDSGSGSRPEDDIWCVRRSERIFLLDAGVVKSSSLTSPPERQETSTSQRAKPEKRRRQKLVSVLRKCSRAIGPTPNDTDSDDQGSDSTENVPLSRLSAAARSGSDQPQQCYLLPEDLHDLTRVVMLEDGLFYTGYINEIQAPDVYGITLDGERGNRPHIFSREEILKAAVREVKPHSLKELPEGRRVCAYWSQQYRCLYPGLVAKATSPNPSPSTSLVYVEFDDGDSGKIPIEDVRLLPQDFHPIAGDPHPSLVLNKKRSRNTENGQEASASNQQHSQRVRKRKKPKAKKTQGAPSSDESDSDSGEVFDAADGPSAPKKRRREHKHRRHHKHHRCHHRHKHHKRHREHSTDAADKKSSNGKATRRDSAATNTSTCSSEPSTSGCSTHSAVPSSSASKSGLKVRIRTSSTEMQQADAESSDDASEDSSSSDEAESAPSKKGPAKRNGRLPSVEKSKIAAFLPMRQLWRWSGTGSQRPGLNGKARKEFYKAICRGRETIRVGDCAVFLSTGRPNLPYIGRIETMWESWNGNMLVRVKWFYHPEETKGLARRLRHPKGALFDSSHRDQNDVQTISHKCEVLSWEQYRAIRGSRSDEANADVYYLAGCYNPCNNTISIEPSLTL